MKFEPLVESIARVRRLSRNARPALLRLRDTPQVRAPVLGRQAPGLALSGREEPALAHRRARDPLVGSPNESDLLPATGAELDALGIAPREIALDGGFQPRSVDEHLPARERTFIAGRQSAGSRRTDRRLARYRVGAEGRISHFKRSDGLRRSRLKGRHGARTWTAWSILAYNLDTLAIRAA